MPDSTCDVIVASGVSGTRTVISSRGRRQGVFGAWRARGDAPAATDPANLSRADLVYPEGTMHLVSTTVGAWNAVVLTPS